MDEEVIGYIDPVAPPPQPYHLPTNITICSCGLALDAPDHDPQNVAAWALVRIADTLDRVSKIEVGGLAGMLFGGRK